LGLFWPVSLFSEGARETWFSIGNRIYQPETKTLMFAHMPLIAEEESSEDLVDMGTRYCF
jgi:hypothetical protein